jgi:hypothetical protein
MTSLLLYKSVETGQNELYILKNLNFVTKVLKQSFSLILEKILKNYEQKFTLVTCLNVGFNYTKKSNL